jgi:hypothetical protein
MLIKRRVESGQWRVGKQRVVSGEWRVGKAGGERERQVVSG